MGRIRTITYLCVASVFVTVWIFAQPITHSGLEWQQRRCTNNLVPASTNFFVYIAGASTSNNVSTNANGLFYGTTNFANVYYAPSANGFPTIYTNTNPDSYTVFYDEGTGQWSITGDYGTDIGYPNPPPTNNMEWFVVSGFPPAPTVTIFSNTVIYSTNGTICY